MREGFRRLAIIIGAVFAVPALIFSIGSAIVIYRELANGFVGIGVGFLVFILIEGVAFGLGWGIVRIIGWVVFGFVSGSDEK